MGRHFQVSSLICIGWTVIFFLLIKGFMMHPHCMGFDNALLLHLMWSILWEMGLNILIMI